MIIKDTELKPFPIVDAGVPNYYSFVLLLPWTRKRNRAFIHDLDTRGIVSDILKYGFCPIYQRPMFNQ